MLLVSTLCQQTQHEEEWGRIKSRDHSVLRLRHTANNVPRGARCYWFTRISQHDLHIQSAGCSIFTCTSLSIYIQCRCTVNTLLQ